ncbi:transposable element Tcb2 transposase [Trichonephila clavipes]|nr:transposable element Tcb2 transposase [Trichonephila clavipes]
MESRIQLEGIGMCNSVLHRAQESPIHLKLTNDEIYSYAIGYSDRDIQYKWNPARSVVIASDMKLSMFDVTDTPTGNFSENRRKAKVAPAIGVSQSVISRIWNHSLETESAGRRPGQGRRRATMPNEDRYLVLTPRRHRNMNTTLLQQHLRSATGTTVSNQTVRNRLHGVGLYARRPMVCVGLTSRHRRDRRE